MSPGSGERSPVEDRGGCSALEEENAKLRALMGAIGRLSGELSLDVLLARAMDEATGIMDADRSSLFLYSEDRGELWSKIAQGLSTLVIRFPSDKGLAGYSARTGQVLNVPEAYEDARFNREFDEKTGYRTRSCLCAPMRNARGKVIGVIQVLNKKTGAPFTAEDEERLSALASSLAVLIENSMLYESIERLFESFVRSSVTAIEERDPTTFGHSKRVALYALNLARAAHEAGLAVYTRSGLRELRYAALLHDIGKIGVREMVLQKKDKLHEDRLELVKERIRRRRANGAAAKETERLSGFIELVERANRPGPLGEEDGSRLRELAEMGLVEPEELEALLLRRGNLTPKEWEDMKSHAVRTGHILSKIAWPEALMRVPEIGTAHHERLDGSGYPSGLSGEALDADARVLAIADVYDALTAEDRPYRRAMPHERAAQILTEDAEAGKLDAGLVRIFFERNLHAIDLNRDTTVMRPAG